MLEKLIFGDPDQIKASRSRRRESSGVPAINRTTSRWRLKARGVIAKTISQNLEADEPEIKNALKESYPVGLREYTPYKIWLQEVKFALANHFKNRAK